VKERDEKVYFNFNMKSSKLFSILSIILICLFNVPFV